MARPGGTRWEGRENVTVTDVSEDETRRDAARLAYALLRLEEPTASLLGAHTPAGYPVLGVDAYAFTPSWRLVPRADIVAFLVSLPSPALLSPTTTRGMIALTLLDELHDERRRWAEKTLSNCTLGLDEQIGRLNLAPDAGVLLEITDETSIYPLASVRVWTQQFGVQVGWSLSPIADNPRAQARLVVRRSDGVWFPPRQGCTPPGPAS